MLCFNKDKSRDTSVSIEATVKPISFPSNETSAPEVCNGTSTSDFFCRKKSMASSVIPLPTCFDTARLARSCTSRWEWMADVRARISSTSSLGAGCGLWVWKCWALAVPFSIMLSSSSSFDLESSSSSYCAFSSGRLSSSSSCCESLSSVSSSCILDSGSSSFIDDPIVDSMPRGSEAVGGGNNTKSPPFNHRRAARVNIPREIPPAQAGRKDDEGVISCVSVAPGYGCIFCILLELS
mmetsp:Transcript_26267/g.48317  ORF Transcript_26267/g.48317 Transcript_26267/m.48317 type:complete len:238 (+) Transcript_26267:245-958(+)